MMTNTKKLVILTVSLLCLTLSQAKPHYGHKSAKISWREPLQGAASESYLSYTSQAQQPAELFDAPSSNNNYNLIMPDYYDHHPAESMQYQNFEQFFDTQAEGNNADLGMEESQLLAAQTPVRGPQPLTAEERRIREHVQPVDLRREKKAAQKLKKGTTEPRGVGAQQWDQFDYDLYSVNPGDNKKYIYG